ncbi:MAG: ABC transporter ATP-binding protein [Chloroflexota bacterium]|nr:ABC transporter ATP-binding protein [Chloroflexota bacterium]
MVLVELTKVFAGASKAAVDQVSLTIEPGEFVVLLGPSGCGKTTLLKMINRIHEPTHGHITIDGIEVHSLPAPALRRRIGYVIQQTGLFPHMRARDNVAVVPRLLKWDKNRVRQRVNELLDLVGLPWAEFGPRYPAQLSGGEQQRVGLARALAADPTMLLMDEPFGAIDAITRLRLQDELRRIHRRFGQTILFVTHDIEEAVRLATKIVVMRAGKVVQFAEPLRIVTEPANDFVAELVGADDVLRRLSLLTVSAASRSLQSAAIQGEPTIPHSASLRTALSLLLESHANRLLVHDDDAWPIGELDLDAIQDIAAPVSENSDANVLAHEAARSAQSWT